MYEATAMLRQDHDAILKMLDATEQVAGQLRSGKQVASDILSGLLEFFQLFADRCHHGREEDLLFPLLESKGMPRAGGPIGVMLHEHDLGRDLIRQMKESGQAYGGGDTAAGARWAVAAMGYAPLLREHIFKENNILFMMAERMLSDEEQRNLAAEFERAELEKMGAGTHERLHKLMDTLLAEIA
ncbi:MAG: hemerythrin domain-containing protein [Acidobacteria bacterium]|nr:hemerythrin domain-containing protein [Acidobacteriota bacterium]MBI3663030.1 hemerythrin domain-containing protein [Acidobacteriota bacterium]